MTLDSEIQVIKAPTPGDDTYIYAINDAAKEALYIALNDTRIQQILGEVKGRVVTKAQAMSSALATLARRALSRTRLKTKVSSSTSARCTLT